VTAPPVVVLDSNVWGLVVHPKAVAPFRHWYDRLLASGRAVVVPEVVDYEVRRSLLKVGIGRRRWAEYDEALDAVLYHPITTAVMRRAAAVWAESRRNGTPFTSEERLDGDAVLLGHVGEMGRPDDTVVATTNVRHVGLFATAAPWTDLDV
jgi:predicted nucleic acid-binding protein